MGVTGAKWIALVDNQLLEPTSVVAFSTGPVQRRERLGGMLSFYHREVA
jgi:hypothetical protein